ncbi:hypothetical protein BDQ12DRAFT_611286, partial [Crucibulum laeve]
GDFSRNHPFWDDNRDDQLFTSLALQEAFQLIDLVADWDMYMALPKGIHTLQHSVSKLYSCPDNVFCTQNLANLIIKCDANASFHPTTTDHFPITTLLTLPQDKVSPTPSYNFQNTNWKEFNTCLSTNLHEVLGPADLQTKQQYDFQVSSLTTALQRTIKASVKMNCPCLHSKR